MKNNTLFIVYLAFLSIIGFLTTDMYLPAFEQMRLGLGTTETLIGATLSLYLAGFALAQLIWGPISDNIGKPKAILYGLSLFVLASLGIFLSHNIYLILFLRIIQAIGVCAAAVCWQALVVEKYPANETNRIFATIMPLVGLSPAIAPTIGAYLLNNFGWRSIFIVLVFTAVILIFYTIYMILKEQSRRSQFKEQSKISYFKMFQSTSFLSNVLLYGICSAGFFAWLTGSPFFLKELGYNENQIGMSFIPQTITFLLGGYGYRAFANRLKERPTIIVLLAMYSLSLLIILVMCLMTTPTLTMLLIPFSIMALSNGATYPIVVSRAMRNFPQAAGKASALQNTIQLGICFLASLLVSTFTGNILLTTAWVMFGTVPFAWFALYLSFRENKI